MDLGKTAEDEAKNIKVLGFVAPCVRGSTVHWQLKHPHRHIDGYKLNNGLQAFYDIEGYEYVLAEQEVLFKMTNDMSRRIQARW